MVIVSAIIHPYVHYYYYYYDYYYDYYHLHKTETPFLQGTPEQESVNHWYVLAQSGRLGDS